MENEREKSGVLVGIACNIRTDRTSEAQAEFDDPETVAAIEEAIKAAGFETVILEATEGFIRKLEEEKPDIVFNIAEGTRGRSREAHVPAMLEYCGVSYTGSDAAALSVSLDKALTKRIAQSCGVDTPGFFVVDTDDSIDNIETGTQYCHNGLSFPMLVKPNSEGSGKGISDTCVANNPQELSFLIAQARMSGDTSLLVEEYIDGREFTVGIIGNGSDMRVFEPMEIIFKKRRGKYRIYSYEVKQNFREYVTYKSPSDITGEIKARLTRSAEAVYRALGCRDLARMDFRVTDDGNVYFLEINPLPGLAPGYSDFTFAAQSGGMEYNELIGEILRCALKRYKINGAPDTKSTTDASEKPKEHSDWHWQYNNRIQSADELSHTISLSDIEKADISACLEKLRMAVTPYYASLIDPADPQDPIRLQAVPSARELKIYPWEKTDPLDEERDSPVCNIVHRYPDRVLFTVTGGCSTYCRHCTRRRTVGEQEHSISDTEIDSAVAYIQNTPEIRDVLVSGGDPLTLEDERIGYILSRLRGIKHVEIIRIGTRIPVTMPMRVTPSLVSILRECRPLWINTHFNHPRELTDEAVEACKKIVNAGIPLGNQSVLLKGVNDDAGIMKELMLGLVKAGVRPYYLYQCDLSEGLHHFRTDVRKGIEIIHKLTGNISGFAIPRYVIDAPGGGGKIPVDPGYIVSIDDEKAVLKNYLGDTYEYPQPQPGEKF